MLLLSVSQLLLRHVHIKKRIVKDLCTPDNNSYNVSLPSVQCSVIDGKLIILCGDSVFIRCLLEPFLTLFICFVLGVCLRIANSL